VNSMEKNSEDFFLDFVQEFGLYALVLPIDLKGGTVQFNFEWKIN
jgi:hypothetical protein